MSVALLVLKTWMFVRMSCTSYVFVRK